MESIVMQLRQDVISRNRTAFSDLPDDVLLEIFSKLGLKDTCRAGGVCKRWHELIHNECLWRQRLFIETQVWNLQGIEDQPLAYARFLDREPVGIARDCAGLSSKDMFILYSSEVAEIQKVKRQRRFQQFMNASSQLWLKRLLSPYFQSRISHHNDDDNASPFRVIMFGPGLESKSTRGIAKLIFTRRDNLFEAVDMVPSTESGVGAGVAVKYKGMHIIHLLTLYSGYATHREAVAGMTRLHSSKLLVTSGNQPPFSVTPAVYRLCQSTDAVIFVMDVTAYHNNPIEISRCLRYELGAMLEAVHGLNLPLLLWACVGTADDDIPNLMALIQDLGLLHVGNGWMVCKIVVDELNTTRYGLDWLLQKILCNRNESKASIGDGNR